MLDSEGAGAGADAEAEAAVPLLSDEERWTVAEVVANHSLAVLKECIPFTEQNLARRDSVARLLNVWPLVCRQARDALLGDESYAPVVFYERVRLGIVDNYFYLDGAPRRLSLFGAPITLEFPTQRIRDLMYPEVIRERQHTIKKLEGMSKDSKKLTELEKTVDPSDLAKTVPLIVRLFVSRVRSMCHGLRGAKPGRYFVQCHNNECCRLFYKGERAEEVSTSMTHDNICHAERMYWNACADAPVYGADCDRFCCTACASQWWKHWKRLMGTSVPDQAAKADAPLHARAQLRASASFEVAIARNAAATRSIRKQRRRRVRAAPAVSRADANREFDARLAMLNVDTGLLYASMVASKVPSLVRNRALPGTRHFWRTHGYERHRNALLRVSRLYRQHPEPTAISNLLNTPAFFRALRNGIVEIF